MLFLSVSRFRWIQIYFSHIVDASVQLVLFCSQRLSAALNLFQELKSNVQIIAELFP